MIDAFIARTPIDPAQRRRRRFPSGQGVGRDGAFPRFGHIRAALVPKSAIVVPKNPEAIEDRERIQARLEQRPQPDAPPAHFAPEVELHRRFGDPVPEVVRVGQQLDVERPLLAKDDREDSIKRFPPKQLDTGLRIAQRKAKQSPKEARISRAQEFPALRVVHDRLRVPL